MNYYAAPMEGLTDRIWRQAHQRWFGAPEAPVRYYAPFLSPPENRVLIKKKMAEQAALGLPLAEEEGTARRTAHTVASAAADFAAKEAFLKAAGTGLREPFSLCEIEAVRLPGGAPAYHFSGRSAQWVEARRLRAHLSLSHEDGMAMAYCILETET